MKKKIKIGDKVKYNQYRYERKPSNNYLIFEIVQSIIIDTSGVHSINNKPVEGYSYATQEEIEKYFSN